MREIGKNENVHVSQGWLNRARYHLWQIGKGTLVAGLTVGGYGLWRFWWKKNTLDPQTMESGVATIVKNSLSDDLQKTQQSLAESFMQHDVSSDVNKINTPLPESFLEGQLSAQDTISRQYSGTLNDELGISFFDKSQNSVDKLSDLEPLQHTSPSHSHEIRADSSSLTEINLVAGEEFRLKIPGYMTCDTHKTCFFGNMSAGLIGGSPLPAWLKLVPPPRSYEPPLVKTIKMEWFSQLQIDGDLLLISHSGSWDLLFNISDPINPVLASNALPDHRNFLKGNLVFTLTYGDSEFQVFDITDPKHPVMIGNVYLGEMTGSIQGVTDNGMAFVGRDTYKQGIFVVDISNPRHPINMGIFLNTSDISVAVQNNIVFLGMRSSKVVVVNLSNPKNPSIMSSIDGVDYMSRRFQVNFALGKRIWDDYYKIINITNLLNPVIIGSLKPRRNDRDIQMSGDLAIIADDLGIYFVSINNPKNPSVVSDFHVLGTPNAIAIKHHFMFAITSVGLHIFDLKDWNWHLVGIPTRKEILTLRVSSKLLIGQEYAQTIRLNIIGRPYIQPPLKSLQIKPGEVASSRFTSEFLDADHVIIPFQNLNFSMSDDKKFPNWLKISYAPIIARTENPVVSVTTRGDLAFAAGDNFEIFSLANPTKPVRLGSVSISWYRDPNSIALYKNVALVVTNARQFIVIDIVKPVDPKIISVLELPAFAYGLALKDSYALVATSNYDYPGGLRIINITNPINPTFLGNTSESIHSVAVKGNFAFGGDKDFQVIDLADFKKPKIITKTYVGTIWGIAVQGNYAYIATFAPENLRIVNITDPYNPQIIASTPLPNSPRGIVVSDKLVFMTLFFNLVQIINIADLTHPKVIANLEMLGNTNYLTLNNNLLLVGTSQGLQILKYGLGAAVLTANGAVHNKYSMLIRAQDFAGISGNGTFWLSVNNPPIWQRPIPAKTVNVGQVLSFQLPEAVFFDKDGDTLTFNSTLSNGSRLPNWITFFAMGQIYTMVPTSADRGQYNISVIVEDGYFGAARAWFLLTVPTRRPVKLSEIPTQNAFVWRPYELWVSSIFMDPDGDRLIYRAQLKGTRHLPDWLHFDNSTCVTGCHFFGRPAVTDLNDLEVELIAIGLGGDISAEFSIVIKTSTLFQDLATYYSVSGAGLVFLSLCVRLWRMKKMKGILSQLTNLEDITEKNLEIGQGVTKQAVAAQLAALLDAVENKTTELLKDRTLSYCQLALNYTRQEQCSLLEVSDPWHVIKKIAIEIERRVIHQLNYKDLFSWCRVLHRLLQFLVETETRRRRTVNKIDKEQLLSILNKATKFIDAQQAKGQQIKHQLELCHEALVSMDDTDSLRDNLCCRDSEMFIDILKTMIVPPYGATRLLYQIENVPSGWYPTIIHLYHLATQAITDSTKLDELQETLQQQKDWRVIYEGVGLLGKIARTTQDEKLCKQALEKTPGLGYYQTYQSFWGRYSSCFAKKSAWIRARATAEAQSITQDDFGFALQENDIHALQELRMPILDRSTTLSLQ